MANRSLFCYSGTLLIVLALVLLHAQTDVKVEGSLMGETERMGFGWIFAPVLGAWAFASMVLTTVENYGAKPSTAFRSLPALLIIYVLLGYAAWMAVRFGAAPFWWMHFGAVAAPSTLSTVVVALHL